MSSFTSRLYTGPDDLQQLITWVQQTRPQSRIHDYPSPADLRELVAFPDVLAYLRLWHNEAGQLAAFAFVDAYHNLNFELDWTASTPALETSLVNWGITCRRRSAAADESPLTLDASSPATHPDRLAFLERHGFIAQPTTVLGLSRSLALPIPEPSLPPGFSLRHARTDSAELASWVALHRAAFGTQHMTIAHRQAMISDPEYDPTLDLLIIAPDGRLAAYCVGSIKANTHTGQREGFTDPVATHPDFQGRGLAKAILLAGMHRLQARGVEIVLLGTSSENKAMLAAAHAVGFHITATTYWFTQSIELA